MSDASDASGDHTVSRAESAESGLHSGESAGARVAGSVPAPAYLTPSDLAGELQVSEKSVYRYARDNPSMPQLHIGGVLRFPRERLRKWLRAREGQSLSGRRPFRKQVLSPGQIVNLSSTQPDEPGDCAHSCAQEPA